MAGEIASTISAIAVVLGSLFCCLAAIGIVRLPDLYTRMHAASKAGAVGAGLVFIAIAIVSFDLSVVLRCLAGVVFLLLTTPVSAHLLARAAHLSGYRPTEHTVPNDLADTPNTASSTDRIHLK